MKIRYKISSFTSESPLNPAINLASGSGSWQSARFCTYPQQITLMFHEPATINKIKLVTHHSKVPSKINLLYHLPTVENQNQFAKIGYVVFKAPRQQNEQSPEPKRKVLKQMKVIRNLQLKAQYLRLLIGQNHPNKSNFFNQVSICSIQVEGIVREANLGRIYIKNDSLIQMTNYSNEKLSLLTQFKQNCIHKEQYNEAKQIKDIILQVKQLIETINVLNLEKKKFIHEQNYTSAKQIKDQISQIKDKIDHITNNFYDPNKKLINKFNIESFINSRKSQDTIIADAQFENQFLKNKSENISQNNSDGEDQNDETIQPFTHQQKIVPAVLNKLKGSDLRPQKSPENQSLQGSRISQILPEEPEQLSPSNEANASVLAQFYDKLIIRKLHSKYWQFRSQALDQILKNCKDNSNTLVTKNQLRSYMFVYNRIMTKQNNKQFILTAIDMINCVTGMKIKANDYKNQLNRQFEKSIIQTLDKTQDSQNPKIKMQAEKVILRMIESSIFGGAVISHAIIRAYNDKLSPRIKKIYLENLLLILNSSQGKSSVPSSIVQFSVKKLQDANNEVRKGAINLLKALKKNGYQEKIKICIAQESSLKQSYLKELNLL